MSKPSFPSYADVEDSINEALDHEKGIMSDTEEAERILEEIQEERKRSNIPPPTPEERAETIGRINARDGVIDPEE